MGVNSLPKTVTRQRRGCDLNPGPSAHQSSTLTTRLPSCISPIYYDYMAKHTREMGSVCQVADFSIFLHATMLHGTPLHTAV